MIDQTDLDTSWTMIEDDEGLRRAAERLSAGTGPIGVDAERASGFKYGSEAYLVQAYRRGGGEAMLFDPTGITDFAPLAEALAGEEWVLHAASQDIPCLDQLGLHPDRLFDTELAARLLGFERVGLGSIVESLLGVHLEKAHSAADWSRRPLPESWLEYAALDVTLLPDLRDAVHAELVAQQKLDFAEQEFAAVMSRPPKPPRSEPWRKVSGSSKLRTPRQVAMVRELWTARDELARARDIAPGRLIPDSSIIAAVTANPRSAEDLARLPNFKGRASRSELSRWWSAILRGKTTSDLPGPPAKAPDAIPHHRGWSQRYPEAAARLADARAVVEAEAERQRMPVENLLTPDTLRRLVWRPPMPATTDAIALRLTELGAREWQVALTAPILTPVFVDNS